MSVVDAVERDLAAFRLRDARVADSAEAATALALAAELDAGNSATSKAMCAKALNETLLLLRERLPEEKGTDRLDDLAARRAIRIAGRSAS